jgi:MoaA/NifB/PqqE/SkfB family radical SAM enzyme
MTCVRISLPRAKGFRKIHDADIDVRRLALDMHVAIPGNSGEAFRLHHKNNREHFVSFEYQCNPLWEAIMNTELTVGNLYRLPWNFSDNAISWLEPTSQCNLYCDGCYRENRNSSHKSLHEIQIELDVFERLRKCDGVSIAGGEPLTHPEIVEIVRMVKRKGWKAIINSNGALLSRELLRTLKSAGVDGFTFHIDSGQSRPYWKGKDEIALNVLRQELADLVHEVGGINCSFNATVYPETLAQMPAVLQWGQQNIDRVHVMVFINYRMAILGKDFDFYVGDEQVYFDDMMYSKADDERRTDISSPEVVDMFRTVYPDFMPSAYLNGTEKPDSFKWLMTGRMGNSKKIFGYTGPRFMEIVQVWNHLVTGKYLAYSTPSLQRKGRLYFLLAPFDRGLRNIAAAYLKSLFTYPSAFFKRLHFQSVMIIQPADIKENGAVNMCDGCPDITVWNNELVWSCRMEEQMRWGQNVRMVPREHAMASASEERGEVLKTE